VPKVSRSENDVNSKASDADSKPVAPKAPSVEIPHSISVRELSDLLQISAIEAIKQLMRNGIMASINDIVDFESAGRVAVEYGFQVRKKPRTVRKSGGARAAAKKQIQIDKGVNLQPRPPVVTVMGHVDHGKTRLLDAVRHAKVMDSEAGGITQHIGAYQTVVNGQKITFLDTPGHEAFTAMRAHGAQITDITILVVAADDGVMPQTKEAIDHAHAAGVPIIVAINKIDKSNANPDLVKQQLAEADVLIEEWGGDIVCVPISAKEKTGISDLLENLLLVTELEDLKADPTLPGSGVVIEAKMDKSRGSLASVLVQSGTLKVGDIVVVGTTWGRIRAMFSDTGKQIKKAGPSTPVEILGLNSVPQFGDTLTAVADEHQAQSLLKKRKDALHQKSTSSKGVSLHNIYDKISSGKVKELNLVLKTDVQGSIEPIRSSLEQLGTEDVKVRIIHSGTGNVTESDVTLAIASEGLVIGFNVTPDEGARRLANSEGIDIRHYSIIYNITDDVEKALKGMLEPVIVEVVEGHAEVRAVFSAGKGKSAAGAYITEGKATRNSLVRVKRGKDILVESSINSLRRFKDDVREVNTNYECGIGINDFGDFKVGDILEFYKMEKSG